jgi:hypothetical protein
MDPLVILLIIITTILTVLLMIVGVQVISILKDLKVTLFHLNRTLEVTDEIATHIAKPLSDGAEIAAGVRTGLKLTDSFVQWLAKNQEGAHDKKSLDEG